MNNFPLRLILCDLRSTHNVGSILRTADGCGVELVYACGYTPYPLLARDTRPAHVAASNTRAIAKTALGAEATMPVQHHSTVESAIKAARADGFKIIVLEQAEGSLNLYRFRPSGPIALVLGNEVDGVPPAICANADAILELPMTGSKESLNVAVSAGITMYHLRFNIISKS